jgi:hypothetical protein
VFHEHIDGWAGSSYRKAVKKEEQSKMLWKQRLTEKLQEGGGLLAELTASSQQRAGGMKSATSGKGSSGPAHTAPARRGVGAQQVSVFKKQRAKKKTKQQGPPEESFGNFAPQSYRYALEG